MESKKSEYVDRKGAILSDGDKAHIEYYEKGQWTDYNTVKIIFNDGKVLVDQCEDSFFKPAPAPITTFSNDKNFRLTKIA